MIRGLLAVFVVGALCRVCPGNVVLEEDGTGAFHINTSDPDQQPVFVNGMDVQQMYTRLQEQQKLIEVQQDMLGAQNMAIQTLGNTLNVFRSASCPASARSTISAGSGDYKWNGGVLAPNGLIYAIPAAVTAILIIDPNSNTADRTSITGLSSLRRGCQSATNTADVTTIPDVGVGGSYNSALRLDDNLIYGIPRSGPAVLIIDPNTNTVDTTSIAGISGGTWEGAAQAGNGLIFSVPYSSKSVLIIDPKLRTADTTTITGISGGRKWHGAALGGNGFIYGIPYDSRSVLIINPNTKTIDTTTISGISGYQKWHGAVTAKNGFVVGISRDYYKALIIDPITNRATQQSISGIPGGDARWYGGVLADNGLIYGIPYRVGTCLVVDPGC
ncbi:hypothetical protein PTSG_02679 [Salpingoeca rosetta]|uniref:Uncharacterized protein n=1 Tax=Salpingoeca rosetta (strain ATCC 50818 / BSB-021) TaxID=946362 RepID=F2U2Z8_SALR5|nr:uncharacterized protein PTSG_02679 [Salpingoeca rosetta]EGD81992.1 hypothetical protein PTSG_02679 [Salpingoeca rosetta]|eukprot:XP_004996175.1 hypothetical protein PTSG_02679 [Salpingoeca rosetta]